MSISKETIKKELRDENYNRTQFAVDATSFSASTLLAFGFTTVAITYGAPPIIINMMSTGLAAVFTYVAGYFESKFTNPTQKDINADDAEMATPLNQELEVRTKARAHVNNKAMNINNHVERLFTPSALSGMFSGLLAQHAGLSGLGLAAFSAATSGFFGTYTARRQNHKIMQVEAAALQQYHPSSSYNGNGFN